MQILAGSEISLYRKAVENLRNAAPSGPATRLLCAAF